MPQASERMRRRYRAKFGDIGPEHAMKELEKRGWTLTKEWEWVPPRNGRFQSDEELFWIDFLIQEWDFGGLRET